MIKNVSEWKKKQNKIEAEKISALTGTLTCCVEAFIFEMYLRNQDLKFALEQIEIVLYTSIDNSLKRIDKFSGIDQMNLEIIKEGVDFYKTTKEEKQ